MFYLYFITFTTSSPPCVPVTILRINVYYIVPSLCPTYLLRYSFTTLSPPCALDTFTCIHFLHFPLLVCFVLSFTTRSPPCVLSTFSIRIYYTIPFLCKAYTWFDIFSPSCVLPILLSTNLLHYPPCVPPIFFYIIYYIIPSCVLPVVTSLCFNLLHYPFLVYYLSLFHSRHFSLLVPCLPFLYAFPTLSYPVIASYLSFSPFCVLAISEWMYLLHFPLHVAYLLFLIPCVFTTKYPPCVGLTIFNIF